MAAIAEPTVPAVTREQPPSTRCAGLGLRAPGTSMTRPPWGGPCSNTLNDGAPRRLWRWRRANIFGMARILRRGRTTDRQEENHDMDAGIPLLIGVTAALGLAALGLGGFVLKAASPRPSRRE
jgi:hypothetical protein